MDLTAELYPPHQLRRRMAMDIAANVLIAHWGEEQMETIQNVLVQAIRTTEFAFVAIGAAPSSGGLEDANSPEAKAHISKINETWEALLNKLKPFSYERLDGA
jgi:hypothetical protein